MLLLLRPQAGDAAPALEVTVHRIERPRLVFRVLRAKRVLS